MAHKENKLARKRLNSSYITSVISISLVLFLLGIVGFLVLNARNLNVFVRENISINLELKNSVRDADLQQLKKILDAREFVKSTEYISKEEAAIETQKALGEDFLSFLGYNPLPATIKVKLKAPWANPDSIEKIEKQLRTNPQVADVYYKKSLIHEINDNVRKISLIISAFSLLLLLIALTLINNTIRLSVYAKRFIIHTMQIVGATRGFIRRPFILTSIYHGFLASLIAIGLILVSIYVAQEQLSELVYLVDAEILGLLFLGVCLTGILISLISTFIAVNKYLNLSKDDLFL
jgi:cell division transport system permease protein